MYRAGAIGTALAVLLGIIAPAGVGPARAQSDPTRPPDYRRAPTTEADTDGELRLESIVVSPDRRIAVINGRSLRIGDRIAGAQLTDIAAHTVHVRFPEGRVELRLSGHPVKSEPMAEPSE